MWKPQNFSHRTNYGARLSRMPRWGQVKGPVRAKPSSPAHPVFQYGRWGKRTVLAPECRPSAIKIPQKTGKQAISADRLAGDHLVRTPTGGARYGGTYHTSKRSTPDFRRPFDGQEPRSTMGPFPTSGKSPSRESLTLWSPVVNLPFLVRTG